MPSFRSLEPAAPKDLAAPLLLVGGRIWTGTSDGEIEADVLIRDGKIVEVGSNLEADGARRVDGMAITPGLIDSGGTLWLSAGATRYGASDGSLSILDGVDVFSKDWAEVARQGVTAVYVQPPSTGNLGGSGALLRVAAVDSSDQLVIKAPVAVQAAIGVSGRVRTSRDRFSQYDRIKKAFAAAKTYQEAWDKYDKYQEAQQQKKKADEGNKKKPSEKDENPLKRTDGTEDQAKTPTSKEPEKKPAPDKEGDDTAKKGASTEKTPDKPPKKPTRDPAKDLLARVLKNEFPLRVETHREDDVRSAGKLADEFGIDLILEGVSNPRLTLDDVHSRRTPLVIGPLIGYDSPDDITILRPAGWLTSLLSHEPLWGLASRAGQGRGSRMLRVHAAAAVAAGIDREQVLRAITVNAAAILGVADRLGTVEKGKQADLAVFAGDPLDPSIPVRMTILKGQISYEADVVIRPSQRSTALDQLPRRLPPRFAIRGRKILRADGRLHGGTLIVQDGKIEAIRQYEDDVVAPTTFDIKDAVLTPGLFALARSGLGLRATSEDASDVAIPEIRIADALAPTSPALRELAQGGVLRIAIRPASNNVMAGNAALLRGGSRVLILDGQAAAIIVLAASARNAERFPVSLSGQIQYVDRLLREQGGNTTLSLPSGIAEQLIENRRSTVMAMTQRRRPVWFVVQTAAETVAARQIARQHNLNAAVIGPLDLAPLLEGDWPTTMAVGIRPVDPNGYGRYVDQVVAVAKRGVHRRPSRRDTAERGDRSCRRPSRRHGLGRTDLAGCSGHRSGPRRLPAGRGGTR